MPRNEENNPTARIGRLLQDCEELENFAQQCVDMMTAEQVLKLPPYPRLDELKDERTRRRYTLPKTTAARNRMRRFRQGERDEDNIYRQRGHQHYEPSMDQEIEAGLTDKTRAELAKLLGEE